MPAKINAVDLLCDSDWVVGSKTQGKSQDKGAWDMGTGMGDGDMGSDSMQTRYGRSAGSE